jgi:hypothetical protein
MLKAMGRPDRIGGAGFDRRQICQIRYDIGLDRLFNVDSQLSPIVE